VIDATALFPRIPPSARNALHFIWLKTIDDAIAPTTGPAPQ
jgi:hypothetical protein